MKNLDQQAIQAQLDTWLEVEFTFLKTGHVARVIAALPASEQRFILQLVRGMASTNVNIAHEFITRAIESLDAMDPASIEAWALHAMDQYDQSGLHAAMKVVRDVEHFIQQSHERNAGAVFEEQAGVLAHFAHGLAGRPLKLAEAEQAWTDTETIFLPPLVARLPSPRENFTLYKAMVAYHWAQNRFGSFRADLHARVCERPDGEAFLALFHALDTERLLACIERELPGLARDITQMLAPLDDTPDTHWQTAVAPLRTPGTTVDEVLAATEQHLATLSPPSPRCFQGVLDVAAVAETQAARLACEKKEFRHVLRKLADEMKGVREKPGAPDIEQPRFETRKLSDPDHPEGHRVELTFDGEPVPVPDIAHRLTTSIVQDLGEIPDEYLTPAGDGEYDPALFREEEEDPDDVWKGTYHEKGAFLYNEWDYRRQHYRKNWCAVREKDVTPGEPDFYRTTLHKYGGFIKHLRKTFEAMRDEDRLLKRQVYGDDVDIDALVEALADSRDGSEMSDRLFQRMHRTERNIAVCFMVDMSGSTRGWINEAERESLILLAETLETLGDRYAIYGFSGMARKKCEIFRIKTFDETYGDEVRARISGITPQDYTRMGFAIRHLSRILNDIEARTRILITLSDGKPDDYDSYRGEYGIEDTRRALIEARRAGIHPYCITIDREARDYLPHMYGPAAYTLIDEVRKLPLKVSDIYRRLTT